MWEGISAGLGLVGAIFVAFVTYVGIRRRVMTELEGRYDADLRTLRLDAYANLWAAMEPLATYAREPPGYPTRSALEETSKAFRRWYFTTGGLYLSPEARDAYFQFQRSLAAVVTSGRWGEGDTEQVDEETFEDLRRIGSWLRTTLTYDVGTRRRFSLAPDWTAENRRARRRARRRSASSDLDAKLQAGRLARRLREHWATGSEIRHHGRD